MINATIRSAALGLSLLTLLAFAFLAGTAANAQSLPSLGRDCENLTIQMGLLILPEVVDVMAEFPGTDVDSASEAIGEWMFLDQYPSELPSDIVIALRGKRMDALELVATMAEGNCF